MSLTTEIEKTKRGLSLENRCQLNSNWNMVIGSYLELQNLDLGLVYMDRKLRHRPKTFMRVQDSKGQFSSSNCSNNREVEICPAAQTLFSVQPISRVLEVQMTSFWFCWKSETFPRTFMKTICSNYNVSNDVFCRQEDKDCYQVKRWPPTQQLVIK